MGKIAKWRKQRKTHTSKPQKVKSIKRTFIWYLPLCVVVAYLGAYGIGWVANELQYWFEVNYSDLDYQERLKEAYVALENMENGDPQETEHNIQIEFARTVNGITYYDVRTFGNFVSDNPWLRSVYHFLSYSQGTLMLGWVLLCFAVTGIIFYKRELEKPINVLMDASEKISDNCLDFEMKPVKQNELGQLCRSFENMRKALYKNNQELWRTLEERKRLNAAFSHDIRTPLSVLKGYQEMLETYVPEGKFDQARIMEMIETMGGQIRRLENYTQKMSAVQKLEDIVPEKTVVNVAELAKELRENGDLLAGELEFELKLESWGSGSMLEKEVQLKIADNSFIDKELVLEVFENLVSNAARFAKSKITVTLLHGLDSGAADAVPEENAAVGMLSVVVEDDGPGFSTEALHRGMDAFYGSEKDGRVHFGLGLYICKTICEKHGGELTLENRTGGEVVLGGRVTARFGA